MSAIDCAIINKSTLCTDAEVLTWTLACAKQAREHAAPLWGWEVPTFVYLPDERFVGPDMSVIYVFDDADSAGALGYHDVDPAGRAYGKVFARDCQNNGVSVSSCLSHETLELCGDPDCNGWSKVAPDGYQYALELCDAVEADSYRIDNIDVSNFVLPAFFAQSSGGGFDYLNNLTHAFQTGVGGYQIRRNAQGAVSQVYGDMRAEWRAAGKAHAASRTSRRGAHGSN